MGIVLLLILALVEITLAIWTLQKAKDTVAWRRNRLISRGIELAVVLTALLLPFGQKWRLSPVMWLLMIFLAAAAIAWLVRRKNTGGDKKNAGVIAGCILNIVLFAFILLPAFVFSGYKGLPTTGSFEVAQASAILVDESRKDPFETDGSNREVPVHFFYPKNAEGEIFPLVVFSHGAFGYYQSNFSTYEELASNGYVVAALDHMHHAFFTHDTDGKLIIVDQDFINTAITISSEEDYEEAELRAVEEDWMSLRVSDMDFVISSIKEAKDNDALSAAWFLTDTSDETIRNILKMTDTDKIGVMGHSMGGATSVEIGRKREDIDAVIDIDGTMMGEYKTDSDGTYTVSSIPYDLPILEFVNWTAYNELAKAITGGVVYPNDVLIKNADEGFCVTIKDTEHMDFTDLPLLSPFIGNMLGRGERGTKETMTIVNSLILDFYNCYLKGQGQFMPQGIY